MWLFKHTYFTDGSLSRYTARLIANGNSQKLCVDYDETFSLMVKPATIRTVLSLATSWHWLVHQLDVKNDFLHGTLSETVYMHQPPGFQDPRRPNHRIIASLHQEFSMTDLGPLNHFLGISVTRTTNGMFLNLKEALQYLTFTRPDLSYAVQQVCLYTHDPREPHLDALKRILRYVRGYCVFLGNNLMSCSSKRQYTLSRSNVEAEYRGVANVLAETSWLRILLRELHSPLHMATIVYCDTVAKGRVRVLHVLSRYQYADIFTKGLPYALFDEFQTSLSVLRPPRQLRGAVMD
nr:hypothetical protein [Tanacetum cinerariifolium]